MKEKKNFSSPGVILAEQRRLLQLEYHAEKEAFTEAADRTGISRLVENGNAWFPIRIGDVRHNSLNQRIIEVFRTEESEAEHNFEFGRSVMFFIEDSGNKYIRSCFNGSVSYVDGDRMVVEIPESAILPSPGTGQRAGVMLSFDETSYKAMFDAIDRTISARGRLGELRDLIYSGRKASEHKFAPLGFPYLNPSQQKGVNKVLAAKEIAVVHGPPGTGKTTTLVEAIYETLRRESQVLVCAQSNSAVDLICERLTDRGINVLRIGNPTRVNDKMLSFTYERRFEAHPDYPTLWKIRKDIRELRMTRRHSDQWHQKIDRLRSRATELEIRIKGDIFGEARVIASTLVGSSSHLLDGMKFSTLFIDEAAQALEAASLIPMRRAGRVIFAGDHCQLPPTVKCHEALKQGLGVSLMERVVSSHPECVVLLTMQYRMHEDIMRFSSEWFYNGAMQAAPEVRNRGILDLDIPVEWIDSSELIKDEPEDEAGSDESGNIMPSARKMSFAEALAGESHGRINKDEALLTLQTLQNYINKIGKRRIAEERIDIAVISPYRAQVRYLRRLIASTPYFRELRKQITVNTVDGFQGRESDIVVISLVRSNERGDIGFLRDLRRMNVAMTRARMKLIIIGNATTMSSHPFYRKLLSYVRRLDQESRAGEDRDQTECLKK